jgi:4-hydroxy-2-oxoheptanedioate aldolase
MQTTFAAGLRRAHRMSVAPATNCSPMATLVGMQSSDAAPTHRGFDAAPTDGTHPSALQPIVRFRALLDSGEGAIGGWLMLGSPFAAEIAASQRFDFVVVDCQHGLNGQDRLIDIIGRLADPGPLPLVRVPSIEAGWVGRALDVGAAGVIVPMVNSRSQAEAAVAAARYAPAGVRSYGPVRPYRHLGGDPSTVNDNVLCMVMIETGAGLERVDEICATPGIDGVYIGPADLALSLNLRPSRDAAHPVLVSAIREIRDGCLRNNVTPAIHATNGAMARMFLADGFRMVTAISDIGALRAGLARELSTARLGDE